MRIREDIRRGVNDFLFDKPDYRRWRAGYHIAFWTVELLIQVYIYRDLHPVGKPAYAWVEGFKHITFSAFMFYTVIWWWSQISMKRKWVTVPVLAFVLINGILAVTYIHDYLIIQYELLPESRAFWQVIYQRSGTGFWDFYTTNWLNGFILYQLVAPQSLCFIIKLAKESVKYANRNLLLEQENLKFAKDNLDLELGFLKAQINPHFFFNTLNSLYSLAIKKSDQTPDLILRLSDLMRYTLYNTDYIRTPVQDEIDFLQNYFSIEQTRLGQRVRLSFEMQGNPAMLTIPPLLLIVFVENAFKHGIKNELKQGWVDIRLTMDADKIDFYIANSVPAQAKLTKFLHQKTSGGIGIENARRRLSILYPDRHSLTIESSADQHTVRLSLVV